MKKSFAKMFTAVVLLMIFVATVSLSLVFFFNLQYIVSSLTELNTKANVAHSRDMDIYYTNNRTPYAAQS
jgi:hypothetical protein